MSSSPLQKRQALDRQMMADMLDGLAEVIAPQKKIATHTPIQVPLQALLSAAGAVGHASGITICPPAKSESAMGDSLAAIARASRIRTRRVTLQGEWWNQSLGPMLAYADETAIALLLAGKSYEWFDPAQGLRVRVTAQLAADLEPTAYTFYRPFPEEITPLSLMQFALRGRSKEVATVIGLGIIIALLGMLTPQATAILMDHAIPDANRNMMFQIGLGLGAVALGNVTFQLVQAIAILRLQAGADVDMQSALWDRLLNLPPAFFRQYTIGNLNLRVDAVNQIHHKLSGTALKTIFSGLFSVLNLGLLVYYNGTLAMVAIAAALIYVAITIVSSLFTVQTVRPLLDIKSNLFGTMVQLINGVAKLRVAGAESRAFAYWGKRYRQQLQLVLSTQYIEDILAVINKVFPSVIQAILFLLAVQMLQQKDSNFSLGVFLAFNAAFGSFISSTISLSSTVVDILEVVPLWQRALPILTTSPEVDSTKVHPGELSGQLEVKLATFRYQPEGIPVLDQISLRAEPGEFIAIVGPSGSGKSTLFRLLLGFESPESGSILYDGQDLDGLDVHAVRRQLGVVLQNGRLLSASIYENIAGNAFITLDEAWELADRAGFAEDIQSMPMGMHTVISEGGTNLSGGQRQRLLIARALAQKPKVLLFDEATSALDNRTQAIVSASLDILKVTRIAIAHRLSTIRNADRIYILEKGNIIQQGTFEQLTAQPGLFAQLMARQQA
jgi:NHLM bacteriocin system ABC transporter ATP-binding protein